MDEEPDTMPAYDPQQERVARWIVDRTGIGAGDDPVGFLLASYDVKIAEAEDMRKKLTSLERILAAAAETCGCNDCTCTGSTKVRDLVNAHMERFSQ